MLLTLIAWAVTGTGTVTVTVTGAAVTVMATGKETTRTGGMPPTPPGAPLFSKIMI